MILLLFAVDCSEASGPARNVILLLADTLRADHLSAYGYARATTPALDARAERGVVFERARSQSACTPTSIASLMTSRYPAEIAVHRPPRGFGIPPRFESLAEILQKSGLRTIGISASEIVRRAPTRFNRKPGFARGFDVFEDERCENREARFLNELALKQLDQTRGPFFLYIHYMDPHHPYRPPRSHPPHFSSAGFSKAPKWLREGNPDPIDRLIQGRPQEGDETARLEQVPILVDLYDEEILYLDGEIARFLSTLEARGLLKNTLLIFASDHGEMFLEQGKLKHCQETWDTVTRTPLIVWAPGMKGGRRVASAVENVDIMPTVLDYLEIEREGLRGRSLRPWVEGEDGAPGLAFSQQGLLRSVDDGRFKLILNVETESAQLYDLREDPLERTDVSAMHPALLERFRRSLDDRLRVLGEARGARNTVRRSMQVENRLRALGYLE